jgi:hypothetical protein
MTPILRGVLFALAIELLVGAIIGLVLVAAAFGPLF